jgi:hypothetical protein
MEFLAAHATFERIGAASRAADAARAAIEMSPVTAPDTETARDNVFRREGEYWSVGFDGRVVRVRDMRGVQYLARLLASPGREFHVVDLVAGESCDKAGQARKSRLSRQHGGDAGEVLDARAKDAYRRRLTEIEDDLEEAGALGDTARLAQATAERDYLSRELSRAIGLGGRDRRVGSIAERARASVTRAIRRAMGQIRAHHPALGAHFERAIRTGTYCAYLPDPRVPVAWKV